MLLMTFPPSLGELLVDIKADITAGDVSRVPVSITALGASDVTYPKEAVRRLARMVFAHHPGFKGLGSRLELWPKVERDAFAGKIRDAASDPARLQGAIDHALASARAASQKKTAAG